MTQPRKDIWDRLNEVESGWMDRGIWPLLRGIFTIVTPGVALLFLLRACNS